MAVPHRAISAGAELLVRIWHAYYALGCVVAVYKVIVDRHAGDQFQDFGGLWRTFNGGAHAHCGTELLWRLGRRAATKTCMLKSPKCSVHCIVCSTKQQYNQK